MELSVGAIVEGTVRSITKFGAFIQLPEGKTGMVHISEITHTFVNDIRDHLTEGQQVKAVVINLDNGKINLSIRRTEPAPQRQKQSFERRNNSDRPARQNAAPQPAEPKTQSFDDMLKQFMADSDSKISGLKQYSDRKTRNRRR